MIGNGRFLDISQVDSNQFSSHINHTRTFLMHDIFHVLEIAKNLLNVSKFAQDNHVYFEFHPFYYCVKGQKT